MMRFSSKLFHVVAFVVCLFRVLDSINGGGVMAFHKDYVSYNVSIAKNVDQVYRTGYHFQPKQNWINDPNAPMYYKGYYHLFYQYNPKGATWGNIVWAHSVSKDMINWISLEPAIVPSKPFDKYGCWSGSATILPGNKPVILYTGIIALKPKPGYQVQNYAIPANYSDPFLKEWIKPDENPIVKPTYGQNVSSFRDPTTAWFNNGHWKMIIGSKHNHRGIAYLYRTRDFVKWTKAKHTFHDKPNTGMWECPDFYPVSTCGTNGVQTSTLEEVKHVFKVSLDDTRFEYYTIGTYDTFKDRYYPDPTFVDGWAGLRYDYGNFYASKTFFDPAQNRRILWGWANESSTPSEDVTKGWAGIQLIPRMVWMHPNGKQLMQWPIHEVESLRGDRLLQTNVTLNKGEMLEINGITVAQADMEVTFTFSSLDEVETFEPEWFELPSENLAMEICGIKSTKQGGLGPFGVLTLASKELEEYTPVFFRVFKTLDDKHKILMCSDATHSSLNKGVYKPPFAGFVDVDIGNKKLSLRILIDHSVVESFGEGGMTVITSRVYPTLAIGRNAHLYLFNNGTETITVEKFDVWSMNSPHVMN